jgi:hypothetical protein
VTVGAPPQPRHGRAGGARGAGRGEGPRAPRRPRLPTAPAPARQVAPRDGRWWTGAGLLCVSLLLLGALLHVVLLSSFQHHRAQTLGYQDLRSSLARAETPVGQLDVDEELVVAGTPVALLEIPAIGLHEVIQEGTGADVLRAGPGHRRDSVMPGQVGTSVLLGRQTAYGGPFADLARLEPGDAITVTTGQGVAEYTVFGLRREGDLMPEALGRGAGRLELMTADGLALFPSGVLHVDAELTTDPTQTPSRVMSTPALPPEERAMGQDLSAWSLTGLVLLLLLATGVGAWWLWSTWGRRQAWLVAVPVVVALGAACAYLAMDALPNLL